MDMCMLEALKFILICQDQPEKKIKIKQLNLTWVRNWSNQGAFLNVVFAFKKFPFNTILYVDRRSRIKSMAIGLLTISSVTEQKHLYLDINFKLTHGHSFIDSTCHTNLEYTHIVILKTLRFGCYEHVHKCIKYLYGLICN